ncbi:putative O-glycosylation ligase, exosortase A system-associated [Vibrio sp. MA40-2]|uniref:putative O-glycosylation ligase, exosortase A system-associated n=1 Tax=Vibrio sp. MA40-2 TaxID=3391828 RepID=UPI0039A65949
MRDLFFLGIFCILLPLALKRPFISLSLWFWSGLFVPVYWLYGIAESISYNTVFAACTIIGYLVMKNKPQFQANSLFFLVCLFFIHTTITSFTTIAMPEIVWISWENFFKVILLFVFTCLIIRKKHQFEFYIWMLLLSIGFLGFVEALKFAASAGGHHIKGPAGHILSDNNHMALALCMTLPMIIYLISETKQQLIKLGLIAMLLLCTLAILGTFSRGGFIGLSVVGGYFWLKSQSKLKSLVLFSIVVAIALSVLPDRWFDRMNTMESVESALEDSSFATRLNSWKIHTLMAMDRPLVGGGFKAPQFGFVWRELALDIDKLNFVETPDPGEKGWAAHSIYFQVLGDHGFVGLMLFIAILIQAFIRLYLIEKFYKKNNMMSCWQANLTKNLRLSLLSFCVAGAALSLAYVEILYALLGLIFCLSAQLSLPDESSSKQTAESL